MNEPLLKLARHGFTGAFKLSDYRSWNLRLHRWLQGRREASQDVVIWSGWQQGFASGGICNIPVFNSITSLIFIKFKSIRYCKE